MTGMKLACLFGSVGGLSGLHLAQISGIIDDAKHIETLGLAGVLGLVAMVSIYGIVKLYKLQYSDNKEMMLKLQVCMEQNTAATREARETQESVRKAFEDVSRSIEWCKALHGGGGNNSK